MRRAFALSAARQSLQRIGCRPRAALEREAATCERPGIASVEGSAR